MFRNLRKKLRHLVRSMLKLSPCEIQTSHICSFAGEIRIAFVLYKHIGVYLSTENASMKFGSEAMATNYSVIVNSPVITAAINKDSNKVYLSDPVIFTIRHLQVSLSDCICGCI